MHMNKILTIIASGIVATLAIVYFLPINQNADFSVGAAVAEAQSSGGQIWCVPPGETEQQFCGCTQEARYCPDGTLQGRVPTSCNFAPECQPVGGGDEEDECPPGWVMGANGCRQGPPPPTQSGVSNLVVSSQCSTDDAHVNLSWTARTTWYLVPSFDVLRCEGAGCVPSTVVHTFRSSTQGGGNYSWTDNGVASDTSYRYQIRMRVMFNTYTSGIVGTQTPACVVPPPECPDGEDCPADDAISVDLEIQRPDITPGVWSDADITNLGATEDVYLKWDSNGATSCSGSNFTVGGQVDGQQNNVTEPQPEETKTYTVICTNGSNSASDSISVTRVANGDDGGGPSITAGPNPVNSGDESELVWSTGSCAANETTITADKGGTGLPDAYATALPNTNGFDTVTITETTTFTISCPLGSDSVTVRARPVIYES